MFCFGFVTTFVCLLVSVLVSHQRPWINCITGARWKHVTASVNLSVSHSQTTSEYLSRWLLLIYNLHHLCYKKCTSLIWPYKNAEMNIKSDTKKTPYISSYLYFKAWLKNILKSTLPRCQQRFKCHFLWYVHLCIYFI